MKRLIPISCFVVLAASFLLRAANATDAPRVSRTTLAALEESLDSRWKQLSNDNAVPLPGPTRGVYLDGYGVVFTFEVNLVTGPAVFMFHPQVTPDEVKQHRQKKLARIPELRRSLREGLLATAASLDNLGDNDQVVLVAMLAKYPWEDVSGMPQQIMMQGAKRALLDAKRAGGAAIEQAIRVTEN